MNLHTPERQAHETQQQYRERQALSKAITKVATKGPTQARHVQIPGGPLPNWVLWWKGQHINPARNAERKLVEAIGHRQERRARMSNRKAA